MKTLASPTLYQQLRFYELESDWIISSGLHGREQQDRQMGQAHPFLHLLQFLESHLQPWQPQLFQPPSLPGLTKAIPRRLRGAQRDRNWRATVGYLFGLPRIS